ncbi:hypothetical protein P154DRAFT_581187 [Amniculicola lignicola CBS 123094]|uniref:DUF7923 domain-containing protein n=1 Tax=Amniculicola lignicola CBS 123094 TaxID=1392246 RepID=A0A6A5W4N3_9PLEO|nr:hypothetical protein P154DRAFT_581187 [Amniculicola lignicola CBS 123094]
MADIPPPPPPPPAPLSYRDRLAQFRILEEKRCELIEVSTSPGSSELLDKLEKTEAKLRQTELDLQSEQNVRRTLQSEVSEVRRKMQAEVVEARDREMALAQRQARRPFALVLIDADADGFLFQDKFITRRAQGGEALADELLVRIRDYLRPHFEDFESIDVLVRVYCNLEGMANYLVRDGRVRNLGQLRAFSTGFCGRIPNFDWVDVGVGKEGSTGRKIRENLAFYTANTHLRHAIVACSPEDLPASLLTTLPLEKITLIESFPLPPSLTTLPLHITKMPSLFTPPPPPRSPKARGRSTQFSLSQKEDSDGGSTWLVIKPERSKSQGAALRRRERGGGGGGGGSGGSDDESSLSISIGPDNTVSVDSGRRRRIMG